YAARNETGLYDAFATQIQVMGEGALANLDYPDNITRKIEAWNKSHAYLNSSGDELRVAVLGEVAGPALGTLTRSIGNFYARSGDSFKPIDDTTKVKDTIALTVPSCASVAMYNTVINQCIVLGQITAADADEDNRKGDHPIVKDWTKSSVDGREQHDVLVVHLPPKYAVPSAAGAPKIKRVAKRRLDEVDDDTPAPPSSDLVFPEGHSRPDFDLAGDDIKLGAHYDPNLLEDFGGELFNLRKAKLVQHDMRDPENKLIAPWDVYKALRPGTLVLALVSLHCYNMLDNFGKEPKKRKVYQIQAHSLRVLDGT
ncbi:hypothetical protein C8R43DRAFT_842870, partial [Mycena crocata]